MSDSEHGNPNGSVVGTSRRRSRVAELDRLRHKIDDCQAQISTLRREVDDLKRQLSHADDSRGRREDSHLRIASPGPTLGPVIVSSGVEPHPSRAAELRWLEVHYDELAAKYRGQAIAIYADRVVAADPELESVVHQARDAGFADALFTAIPAGEPRYRV